MVNYLLGIFFIELCKRLFNDVAKTERLVICKVQVSRYFCAQAAAKTDTLVGALFTFATQAFGQLSGEDTVHGGCDCLKIVRGVEGYVGIEGA